MILECPDNAGVVEDLVIITRNQREQRGVLSEYTILSYAVRFSPLLNQPGIWFPDRGFRGIFFDG